MDGHMNVKFFVFIENLKFHYLFQISRPGECFNRFVIRLSSL